MSLRAFWRLTDPRPLGLLDAARWFLKPAVWGACLSGAGLKSWVPDVRHEPFTPQGEALGL